MAKVLLVLVAALCLVSACISIDVSVMLALDTVTNDGHVKDPQGLLSKLNKLKSGGVDGVMLDVWWGIVEKNGPRQYVWDPYQEVTQLVKQAGLKLQVVMSFHRCGGNVGDACNIPIPSWVINAGQQNELFYTDREGHSDVEYLSLGVDQESVFPLGRSALEMYHDYMESFAKNFSEWLGPVITEVQVGLGPAGEMRYPAYQTAGGIWSFPGVGEFQCYDKHMLSSLAQAAQEAGHPDWGHGGPDNAGTYNSRPSDAPFYSSGSSGSFDSDYGKFFLSWYAKMLIDHGDRVLGAAEDAFGSFSGVSIAAKIAGIHWWFLTDSHAAELTAGYYNTREHDGYKAIADMFHSHGTTFDFTCLEMRDSEQHDCGCGPEELVGQTHWDANGASIGYSGENALPRYDQTAYDEIYAQATKQGDIRAFTYLRLCSDLIDNNDNWNRFVGFVQRMHSA